MYNKYIFFLKIFDYNLIEILRFEKSDFHFLSFNAEVTTPFFMVKRGVSLFRSTRTIYFNVVSLRFCEA